MAVKRMATVLFLGALTTVLLGALVYLAASGGRQPERNPVPRSEGGGAAASQGPGRPGQPAKSALAPADDFSVLP